MKKIVSVIFTLLLISACSANNNNQLGTEVPRENRNPTVNIVNNERNNQGYNITRTNTAGQTDHNDSTRALGTGTNREERVQQIVNESTRYVGQKMDGDQFIRQVYTHVGYSGFDVKNPYLKAINYEHDAQPGDILHIDLNGDGVVDHHAIMLDNGTIIHSNADGIVEITDVTNQPQWQDHIIHVQRVVKH